MFFDFATRHTPPLPTLPQAPIPDKLGLAVSPDRQGVLYVQGDRMEGDLMLVEDFR